MGRLLSLACLAFPSLASATILIDSFDGGYFKATITGSGNKNNLARGLDRTNTYAGHRYINYTANPSVGQENYVSTVEVGLGEARVVTPGPRDMSTELQVAYGVGFSDPMNLDLSSYNSPGRLFEIDLGTDPPDLFAEIWSIRLQDGRDRVVLNSQFGSRPGGIEFRRDGFVGDPDFDWSDVDGFSFTQSWNAQNTAPLVYWTTEIRVVPEPSSSYCVATLVLALARRRRAKA